MATMPIASPAPATGFSLNQAPLYPGSTGTSGMPTPILSAGNRLNPTSNPMPAPNGLWATPNPTSSSVGSNPSGAGTAAGTTPSQNAPGAVGNPTTDASGLTGAQDLSLQAEAQNYLGKGFGDLTDQFLNSGAGYNSAIAQQAVQSTDNAMQQQINQQYGSLQTSMAEAGLSPDSSGFQLGQSQFLANASASENEVAAQQYEQMWSQSQSQYTSLLEELNQIGSGRQATSFGNEFMGGLGSSLGSSIGSSIGGLAGSLTL